MTLRGFYQHKGNELGALRQAIIDNTKGDLFWIGEILLAELEKETGFSGGAHAVGEVGQDCGKVTR